MRILGEAELLRTRQFEHILRIVSKSQFEWRILTVPLDRTTRRHFPQIWFALHERLRRCEVKVAIRNATYYRGIFTAMFRRIKPLFSRDSCPGCVFSRICSFIVKDPDPVDVVISLHPKNFHLYPEPARAFSKDFALLSRTYLNIAMSSPACLRRYPV